MGFFYCYIHNKMLHPQQKDPILLYLHDYLHNSLIISILQYNTYVL